MGLHLGSSENLRINAIVGALISTVNLIIPSSTPIVNGIKILSSDNFILKDSNGVYLTAKEDENYG